MKQKQYYNELNVLSGIAILCVLVIHGCGSALNSFYASGTNYAANFWLRALSNLVAPAVPIFLFVSGFKFAANDAQTPYGTFLKKRLPRVLMSFAILNTLFWLLDSIKYMESFDLILLAKTYISSWLGNSVSYQLWYIPMYCCVIVLCPLVRQLIPSTAVRFCIFTTLGIAQRLLELDIPVLATYPIRFVSYPVFFELGILAQENNWKKSLTQIKGTLLSGIYILTVILLSWFAPEFSTDGITKYILYYFAGIIAMFALSIVFMDCRLLQWLGKLSYPLFLLHEPLLGRCVGAVLRKFHLACPIIFVLLWVLLTFSITLLLIAVLKRLKWNKVLWEFSYSIDNIYK